jgi:hypothetical protein
MGAHFEFANTDRQKRAAGIVLDGFDAGEVMDLKTIHSRFTGSPTHQATQSVLRGLVRFGYLKVEKIRNKCIWSPTQACYQTFRGNPL